MAEALSCVLIDGVDTRGIGLHRLRRSITIIPQAPPSPFTATTLPHPSLPFSALSIVSVRYL